MELKNHYKVYCFYHDSAYSGEMGFSSLYILCDLFGSIILTKLNPSHTGVGTTAHFKVCSWGIFYTAIEAQTSLQIRCSWNYPTALEYLFEF